MKNQIFVITGPSGVGKDTVLELLEKMDLPLRRVITTASRPMRADESQGNPYNFVSTQEFEQMIEAGDFAEYAQVFDTYKGTTKAELEKAQQANEAGVLLKIDHQGARTIKSMYPEAKVIVITPPSLDELEQRFTQRSQGQEEAEDTRIRENKDWEEDYKDFDYYVENKNNQAQETAEKVAEIIKNNLK